MSTLQTSITDGVAVLRLNRPQVFNSFNREMALAFQAQLEAWATDDAVRVIVLSGNGKAFCAGQDLQEVTDPALNPGFRTILEEHYKPMVLAVRAIEKPVIAAVNGVAAGAGANLALACDIVLASSAASFIQAFSKIGLIPDTAGTYFLPRLIGFQKASALMMLGDKVDAIEAERLGMVYKVLDAEGFEEAVLQLANQVAKMPTFALGMTKKALNESMSNSLETQLNVETELQLACSESHDYNEGVNAFIQKRKPEFKGK